MYSSLQNLDRGGESTTRTRQVSRHYHWLDLIRFTAAFLVLLCHFRGAFLPEWGWLPAGQRTPLLFVLYSFTRLGGPAVLIFFVMSGFLVGGRSIEKLRAGTFGVRDYTIDRAVRILLPLLSALVLFFPKQWICGGPMPWTDWLGCLFSLQGIWTGACIEVLWTLAYEVWFYILMAAVGLLCCSRRPCRTAGMALLAVCFLVFTKLSAHYLFIWLLGAVSYLVMPKRTNRWILVISALLLAAMTVVVLLTDGGHVTSRLMEYFPTQNRKSIELIFSCTFCIFLQQVILTEPRRGAAKWIDRLGTKLAAFSYTLYLVHVLVLRVLQHYGAVRPETFSLQALLLYALWTLVALVFCYGVYWCVERHTYTVKRWLKAL